VPAARSGKLLASALARRLVSNGLAAATRCSELQRLARRFVHWCPPEAVAGGLAVRLWNGRALRKQSEGSLTALRRVRPAAAGCTAKG